MNKSSSNKIAKDGKDTNNLRAIQLLMIDIFVKILWIKNEILCGQKFGWLLKERFIFKNQVIINSRTRLLYCSWFS